MVEKEAATNMDFNMEQSKGTKASATA